MHHIDSSRLLQLALGVDAFVSGLCGVLHVAVPDRLSALLQLPRPLLAGTGEFYLVYAAVLLVLATRRRLWVPLVLLIVLGNLGWGLAGLATLLVGALTPNALGTGFVIIQVAAVAAFAVAQGLGLRRSTSDVAARTTGMAASGRAR